MPTKLFIKGQVMCVLCGTSLFTQLLSNNLVQTRIRPYECRNRFQFNRYTCPLWFWFVLILLIAEFDFSLHAAVLLVYFSENINELAAIHWRSFSRQQYFDSNGLFISTVFSIPILLNCMLMIVSSFETIKWIRRLIEDNSHFYTGQLAV